MAGSWRVKIRQISKVKNDDEGPPVIASLVRKALKASACEAIAEIVDLVVRRCDKPDQLQTPDECRFFGVSDASFSECKPW